LSLDRRLSCALVFFSLSISTARANTPTSWLDDILQFSLLHLFTPPADPILTMLPPPPPPCLVDSIPALEDEQALSFEAAAGTSAVVDITGLTPATALALARFEQRVASLGGKFAVTSAYRPPAYQEHLQVVWDKWRQLRDNYDEGCAVLKAEVAAEFERHRLMESQRPVPFSDHTRGIGFDATVFLPTQRHRNIDRLAQASGVRRPDVLHDPVHFRLAPLPARRVRT
jgi:hypothetical protein